MTKIFSDGRICVRALTPDDIEMDLGAKDDEQMRWLWTPAERTRWSAMSLHERRLHALRGLAEAEETFGPGPKWRFAVDAPGVRYAAYVDCDLANPHVPAGQANIAYSAHPDYRHRGFVSAAVRLVLRFLADCTDAREAHLVIDARNTESLRVVRAVGAREVERWTEENGCHMIRHVIAIERPTT